MTIGALTLGSLNGQVAFLGVVFVFCGAPAAFADATLSTPVKGLVKPVDVTAGDVDGTATTIW